MDEPVNNYLDERDPRKRKRSEEMHRDHLVASPPRIRGDNWAQRAEAFIHKVKDPIGGGGSTPGDGRVNHSYGGSSFNYGGAAGAVGPVGYPSSAYPLPSGGYHPLHRGGGGLNPSSPYSKAHHKGSSDGSPPDSAALHPGGNKDSKRKSKRRTRKEEDEDESSSSSSDSDSEEEKRASSEQRAKLVLQKDQYEKAHEKLEAQLIKLKEQRETLKEGGAKHEDKIMKDNARLQKEVKNRLGHMREVLDKLIVGLNQFNDLDRNKGSEYKRPAARSGRSKSRNKSSSRERSSDKSKKKKKRRHRGRSDSDEYDADEGSEREAKKKNRKRKKKYRSSSSSEDSDSESEGKKSKKKSQGDSDIPIDDSIFRMMSDLKNLRSSKKGDETFMDLLGKMSEAYMKAKQDNNELSHRINALESENQVLKKQLEAKVSSSEVLQDKEEVPKKWNVKTSHIIEVAEPKRKNKKEILSDVPKGSAPDVDTSRSVRAKMIEKEECSKAKKNGHESKQRSVSRERERRSRSRDHHRRREYSSERRSRHQDDAKRHNSHHSRRSRSRERRRDTRSRSKERRSSSRDSRNHRERSRPKEVPPSRDRNEKINLEDWSEKPVSGRDPSLMSLKEKMITKEKECEKKQQWAVVSEVKSSPEQSEAPREIVDQAAASAPRPQVAIQWGQGVKRATPEPTQAGKKTQPLVGKMPWVMKGPKKPGESRFGPPANNSNIPPPGVLSSVPTPLGLQPPPAEEPMVPSVAAPMPPLPPLPLKKNPPKNPTPQAMDMNAMLAAAKAHMRARSEEFVSPEIEIPLPPLPAATDKDPQALNDTRPPKVPSPPPVREKTEMEIMIEKHCPEADVNDYAKPPSHIPDAPKISSKFDLPPGEEDMDPSELAMLGIDPSDLAGFGN